MGSAISLSAYTYGVEEIDLAVEVGSYKSERSTQTDSTMDNLSNTSVNNTAPHPLNTPGFVVFNVVMLLGVVFPVIAVNTVILVALVLESFIVNIIRLVLGSILVSCLLSALGLAMYHIAGIILYLSPVINPPTAPCTITIFLLGFGGGARLVFMATFAVVVYINVKYHETPKKKFVVASFITVFVLWIISFFGSSPLLSQEIITTRYAGSLSCNLRPTATSSHIYIGLYLVCFGLVTLSVTVTILVITVCYLKRLTVKYSNLEKTTVKFGFFLLLGNGINLLGQTAPALISASVTPQSTPPWPDGPPYPAAVFYIAYTLLNIALIPTPILVLTFFNPIRERLWQWLCCVSKMRKAKYICNNTNLKVPRIQTATAGL